MVSPLYILEGRENARPPSPIPPPRTAWGPWQVPRLYAGPLLLPPLGREMGLRPDCPGSGELPICSHNCREPLFHHGLSKRSQRDTPSPLSLAGVRSRLMALYATSKRALLLVLVGTVCFLVVSLSGLSPLSGRSLKEGDRVGD